MNDLSWNGWVLGVGVFVVACGGAVHDREQVGGAGAAGQGGSSAAGGSAGTVGLGGGSGGTGGADAGAGGVTAGSSGGVAGVGGWNPAPMPAECQASAGSAGAGTWSTVTFKIHSQLTGDVSLDRCARVPQVYSCADGYTEPLDYLPGMGAVPCETPNAFCPGGGCENLAEPLMVGDSELLAWNGELLRYFSGGGMCTCYLGAAAPPGKYRATITVYPGVAAGEVVPGTSAGTLLTTDFVLPDDDGIVTFEL